MDQLDDITMTHRLRRTTDHQLLSSKGTLDKDYPSHQNPYGQVTYLPGSLTIHQLLMSLKG